MHKLLTRTAVGLAIGGFFVWLSARDWPMRELGGALGYVDGHLTVGGADPAALAAAWAAGDPAALAAASAHGWAMQLAWLLPYLAILTLVHVLRVVRWKPLLDPIADLDLAAHNRIGAVGFMAMFLLPLRLGELVRPYLVKRETGSARMSEVLATVAVERVADGLMVSLVLFAVLSSLPASDPTAATTLRVGAYGALAVFVGATVLLIGARWQHDRTVHLIQATLGRVSSGLAQRIVGILHAFLRGLRLQPSPRDFLAFVLLTAVYWGINGVGVWCMARAFYLPVDLVGAYAMMACVVVGMMIPNSPGNVGSFWYFLLLPLPLYGVAAGTTQAIAFGIMVWVLQLLQQGAFGAWFVIRGDVAWRRVIEAAEEGEALAVDTGAALT